MRGCWQRRQRGPWRERRTVCVADGATRCDHYSRDDAEADTEDASCQCGHEDATAAAELLVRLCVAQVATCSSTCLV